MYRLTFAFIFLSGLVVATSYARALDEFSSQDGFVFPGKAERPMEFTVRTTSRPTARSTRPSVDQPREVGGPTPATPADYDTCYNNCPVTSEYNPICGTDNQQYNNPGRLSCANSCGRRVAVKNVGACPQAATGK